MTHTKVLNGQQTGLNEDANTSGVNVSASNVDISGVGVVAIGRNEGDRLKACLASIPGVPVVYVDSGSSDGSLEYAQSVGAHCVALDLSIPFTAARARNAGFEALLQQSPGLKYVMFVDGDCILAEQWFDAALSVLNANTRTAVVCGRRAERFPKATAYNLLCDIEWDTPVGVAKACGGDAVYRVEVFKSVGGFDASFIAGEEPELCFRIRQKGFVIERIDAAMTYHDADMHRFYQWWKRAERSGYAYFLNAYKHGAATDERFRVKEVRSIVVWAGLCAFAVLASAFMGSLWPVLIYALLMFVQYYRLLKGLPGVRRRFGAPALRLYGAYVLLGKLPQCIGVIKGAYKTWFAKPHTLVEYK